VYALLVVNLKEFEGQRGRFLLFCLAPNGTAHAVTTDHANLLLDFDGQVVNVPTSFLRLLHMDESSPFI
jgi:hypothetical protein